MINLLPLSDKEVLQKDMNYRLVLVLSFVTIAFLFCLALILLALYFFILTQTTYENSIMLDKQKEYQTSEFSQYQKIISQNNKLLTKANSFYKQEFDFSKIFSLIASMQKPSNLYFQEVTIDNVSDYLAKVTISGTVDNREGLIAFKDILEGNKQIIKPSFSPDSWLKPKNIIFSLTFQLNGN